MKITALVIYRTSVEIEVPDDTNIDEIREKVLDEADFSMTDGIKGIISESNMSDLVQE